MAQREIDAEKEEGKKGHDAFLKALPPTYLRFDTEGRVIRMDVSALPIRSLTSDLLENVLSRLPIGLVHHLSLVHRAPSASDRSVDPGAERLRYRYDHHASAEVGL